MRVRKVIQLGQLDDASKAFMDWNFKQVESDEALSKLIDEVTDNARTWLKENIGEIRERLKAKMIKGAIEHGAPLHPTEKIEKELEGEYLDLIGWSQILKYNEQRSPDK